MSAETRTSTGVDHPVRYKISADHALRDLAEAIGDTLLSEVIGSIVNQPRSLQKRIGPSELGIPCSIRLLKKLAGVPEPPRPDVPWKPTIGTAVHAYLEEAFTKLSAPGTEQAGRYRMEERVTVGNIGDTAITGSTDLFDEWTRTVVDWKIIGSNMMKKYRAHGPSQQYRVQAHLYGRGWVNAGFDTQMVCIAFLPRETEFTDSFIWTEPYQEQIAEAALDRANKLAHLINTIGVDAAVSLYQPCDDRWCPWCGTGSSWPRREVPTTTAELFK